MVVLGLQLLIFILIRRVRVTWEFLGFRPNLFEIAVLEMNPEMYYQFDHARIRNTSAYCGVFIICSWHLHPLSKAHHQEVFYTKLLPFNLIIAFLFQPCMRSLWLLWLPGSNYWSTVLTTEMVNFSMVQTRGRLIITITM